MKTPSNPRPYLSLALPLVLAFPAAGASAAPEATTRDSAAASQDDPKPDKREEVKELCKKLKGHIGERGKEDREAVQVIDQMIKEFAASGPKDRQSITKSIGDCFKQRRQANAEGVRDNQLFRAAAISLGEMGPESVDVLTDWINHKDHRDDMDLQRDLILSLGKTKDESAVKPLLDLLKHHQPAMQAATSEALANFGHLKLDARKEIFEAVLKVITDIKGTIDTDPNNTTERERYDAVRAPMLSALKTMSKQDFQDPNDWRSWWNNNKKKDWDDIS